MALGTYFHFDLPAGGSGFKSISTGTGHFRGLIFWMNTLLHVSRSPLSKGSLTYTPEKQYSIRYAETQESRAFFMIDCVVFFLYV